MSSDWFTAFAGEGVADDPQVRRAAFEADVLEDGLVSAAIEIGFDRLVAVQKSDHEPVRPRTLDEVSNEVEEAVRQEKVEAIVVEKGSALVARLADIQPKPFQWSSEVVGEGLRVQNLPLRRVDYEPGQIELAESVFTAERPAPGTVTVGGVITGQGDYAVFALESVELGNPDLADEAVKAGTDARLMAREGDDAYQEFIDYLRENAEIVVYEDQL